MTFPASPAAIARLGDACSKLPAPPFGAPPTAAFAASAASAVAASASAANLKAVALDAASVSPDNRALMSSKPARATAASSPPPSPPSLPPTGFVALMERDGSAPGLPDTPVSHKSRTDSGSGASCAWGPRDGESGGPTAAVRCRSRTPVTSPLGFIMRSLLTP
ncbi:hypothetical protein VaNZ11_013309 [Volvox africanus]|uniref:Uncharacterized protein n=1 Tax=Volvox africanus TaxID=51714 RepID=A0ABQ5SFT5_9CHLO|nr:hypothetical protein VaNZ11_013309 [Volvox africanus]